MPLTAVRFVTLMLTALAMSLAFCHLMEMPVRLAWDAELWVGATVVGGAFRLFGTVGAALEVGAVVASIVLAFMVRGRHPMVVSSTATGAVLFLLALVLWWILVFPVNQELGTWLSQPVPRDWSAWRTRWESGHAVRAAAQILGFAALVLSVLVEIPKEQATTDGRTGPHARATSIPRRG